MPQVELASFFAEKTGAKVSEPLRGDALEQIFSPSVAEPEVFKISSFEQNGETIELVMVQNPYLLSEEKLNPVFDSSMVGYIARAFLQDEKKLKRPDRSEHYQHTFDGDWIFFLGSGEKQHFYAHTNFRKVPTDNGLVLYVHSLVCDPKFQGRGFATILLTEALKYLRTSISPMAKYIALRTANVNVIKATKKACKNSVLNVSESEHSNSVGNVKVYPVDAVHQRPDLVDIAKTLGERFSWSGLSPEKLIITKAYPSFLIPVFKGNQSSGPIQEAVDALIDRNNGDALCCISDLS